MNRSEFGLFMVKPDAVIVHHDLIARKMIADKKLEISEEVRMKLSREQVFNFYSYNAESELFAYVLDYVSSGASLIWRVNGENCCEIMGKIKRQLRIDLLYDNFYTGFHSSDNQECAVREFEILDSPLDFGQ